MTMYLLKLYPYLFLLFCSISVGIKAQKKELLIIHTNDVHSQIEPTATDDSQPDMGGTLRRQVVIDSLRNTGKAVLRAMPCRERHTSPLITEKPKSHL